MSCRACARRGRAACGCGALVDPELLADVASAVDCARELHAGLGFRPYEVALVWTRWSGGERGAGAELVVREERLRPTPQADLGGLTLGLEQPGAQEAGTVRVSEISLGYGEDFLLGRGPLSAPEDPLPADVSFYYEVSIPGGPRRRFTPKGPPVRDPANLQWTITLLRVAGDRTRAGDPAP